MYEILCNFAFKGPIFYYQTMTQRLQNIQETVLIKTFFFFTLVFYNFSSIFILILFSFLNTLGISI